MRPPESPIDRVPIDVRELVQRSVASLYSHLITRPTGRAVRMAIEAQLAEQLAGSRLPALSLIDLSEVAVLDFSCADEVVAKLLARYLHDDRPLNAFFVFRGMKDPHREAIEVALRRQSLAAVAETRPEHYELIGHLEPDERIVWDRIDRRDRVSSHDLSPVCRSKNDESALQGLLRRRLVLHFAEGRELRALSSLARGLR